MEKLYRLSSERRSKIAIDTQFEMVSYSIRIVRYSRNRNENYGLSDPDGQAIKNLLITLFWWLCPELVINGHLYATIPPLFRITTKKNEYIYLRDDRELEKYKKEHQGEKYQVNRNKG